MPDAPLVRIVAGHYGSGKSEFSVSLALRLAASGRRVAVADLDIVNPYFRSREAAALLEARGVRVISSMLGHVTTLELPAISPEVRAPLADPGTDAIVDLGGDAVGARVLAQFRADVVRRPYELLVVVNAYRPETATPDGVLDHVRRIETTTGLKASGLVSNTHLLRATSTDDVRVGLRLCREVSAACGIPVRYVAGLPDALAGLGDEASGIERVPIGMYLRDEWM